VRDSGYAQRITWRGQSIEATPKAEVRIRFELANAQLFTFDVTKPN
jgi:hypothetical protein